MTKIVIVAHGGMYPAKAVACTLKIATPANEYLYSDQIRDIISGKTKLREYPSPGNLDLYPIDGALWEQDFPGVPYPAAPVQLQRVGSLKCEGHEVYALAAGGKISVAELAVRLSREKKTAVLLACRVVT